MKRILKLIIGALILTGSALAQTTITAIPVFTNNVKSPNVFSNWNNSDFEKLGRIMLSTSGSGGGGSTTVNSPTIVANFFAKNSYAVPVTAVSYTNGQCLGGAINIGSLSRSFPLPVIINDVSMFDLNGNTPELIIDFINQYTTGITDHSNTDLTGFQDKVSGSVLVLSSDWVVTNGISRFTLSAPNIVMSNTTEWRVVITNRSTGVSFPGTTVTIKIGVRQD